MSPAEAAVADTATRARTAGRHDGHGNGHGSGHRTGPHRAGTATPVLRAAPAPIATPGPGRVRALPVPVAEPHALVGPPRARPAAPGQDELPLRPPAPVLRAIPSRDARTTPATPHTPAAPPAPTAAPLERARAVRSLPGVRRASREADLWLPQPTATSELPDAEQLCATLARAVVEVHAGARPASQLLRWFSADLYACLQRRAALGVRIRRERTAARRVAVRRVAVCEPRDGVVEASVVLQDHERVRAVALRLEGWDGRWRVTQLEVG